MVKIQLVIFFLFAFLTRGICQEVALPELKERVTDLTGTLSVSERQSISGKLEAFEESKGSQVVVTIVPTTGDETIEQFAIRLAESWKIGREGVDDGVILLFAMSDRKMRIEVGYGLEGVLTDALSKRIITNVITPEFRSGHFYQGIDRGVDVVLSAVSEEPLPAVVTQQPTKSPTSRRFIFPLLVVAFFVSAFIKSVLTKKVGKGKATGIIAVVIFILGWLFINLFAALFISAIVSIFMSVPSGGRGGRGGGMYWGGGLGGGGFSGGGGGFGGFSGGGGGFGGGGASGGW